MPYEIIKLCLKKKIKMTKQREIIAQIIAQSNDHPDVEEIYKRASQLDKNISLATVYRTVRTFEENDIVDKHDFGDGRARYEEAQEEHHDHIIDLKNNKIIEFHDAAIEELQIQIAKKHGYILKDHRLELYCVPIKDKDSKLDE